MLPVILGIGAAIGSAITAGEAAAIGLGIGAVGTGMLMKNRNQNETSTVDDDELDELVELLVRRRLNKAGRRTRSRKAKSAV